MFIAIILLAGFSLALPTPESQEKDGEVSRKILGSSVVTSVSVIMDTGNGSKTYFSDAVGKPMSKPSAATQLASPINLLNPDRYEFYTFDDSGDLVKRLMTLDEIQGIIASGDGEATNYNSQALVGEEPEKRVDDIVTNVQNVLKGEMEAHKTAAPNPTFDIPDVTATWNMILPAIFGNSNDNILPDKQNGATAETIVIEHTTIPPEANDTMMRTEATSGETIKQTLASTDTNLPMNDVTTEKDLDNSETNAPIISVEINTQKNISNDIVTDQPSTDSNTENSYSNELKSTPEDMENIHSTQNILKETSSFFTPPIITISSPAPFTTKSEETSIPLTIPPLTTSDKMDYMTSTKIYDTTTITPAFTSLKPTSLQPDSFTSTEKSTVFETMKTSSLSPDSTLMFSEKPLTSSWTSQQESTNTLYTSSQTTTVQPLPGSSTPHGLLSTFFLIEDYKHKSESTTKSYSTPSPFITTKSFATENISKQQPTSTTARYSTAITDNISTFGETTTLTPTETSFQTTEENVAKENLKGYIDLSKTETISAQETTYPTTQGFSPSENVIITSTEDIVATTTKPYIPTTTEIEEEGNIKSTTGDQPLKYITAENLTEISNYTTQQLPVSVTERLNDSYLTTLTDAITTNKINDIEKLAVTELLHQLFFTTNVYQINSELGSTTSRIDEFTTNGQASTEFKSETTTELPLTTATSNLLLQVTNTSEPNLVSSIEELISQSANNPEKEIENVKNGEKINQVILNTESKPMSEVQIETATAASALIGTPNTESALNVTISDEGINEAVDSLISQIIYQPSRTTVEDNPITTTINNKYTTESLLTTSESGLEQSTSLNLNEFNDLTNTNIISTIDDRNRYEEMNLDIASTPMSTEHESKTSEPTVTLRNVLSDNPEETTASSEESIQNKISSSTELNLEETQYQSTLYSQTQSITEKISEDITIPTQNNENEELKVTSKPSLKLNTDEEIKYDDNISTENTVDSTSKSNEILSIEASELNQENYNKTSEPFIIVTSSSEYADYASTENIDIYANNTENTETVTSGEVKDTTIAMDLQTATTIELITSTQDFTKDVKTENYHTTENNIINETTPRDSLQDYETTQNNFISESYEYNSTENYISSNFSTVKTDSFITTIATQEPNDTLVTPSGSTVTPTTYQTAIFSSKPPSTTPTFINLPMVTVAPKTEKPAELKLIQNSTTPPTPKPEMTWTLVSTVAPHKPTHNSDDTKTPLPNRQEPSSVDLVPKPLQGFGLEDSTSALDTDVFQFTELCNELAFSFWNSVTSGISFARSVIVSPFAATSMLAMVFLGARGSTSGEMNEILKLDDMVTFNPHSIFKNVIESIEVSKKSGVAVSVFVKELYSDKSKGKLLSFYKERVKQFYDGHVEEVNFREINDVIRRRTNLLVKRQTWGKIQEYLKDNSVFVRPPLAAVSANIFQTDCSEASTEGRDGELHFVVLPSIRQRKLVPVPAVLWRSGFLAGYDPGLDATAVAIGTKDQTISTIFVIPGQQGISAPGDGLMRLEARLIESAFRQGAWSRLLRSLIPRPGLEVQIPRFSHKSVINATVALQRMGLKDLFNSNKADLKGLNGVAHELYLSDIIQVNTFATCGEGRIDETHHSEVYPATTNRSFRRIRKIQHYHHQNEKHVDNSDTLGEPRDYQRAFHDPLYDPSYLSLPLQLRPRQARLPDSPRLRFDRPFLYFVRHNPTGLILHMGRFNPRLLP